MASLVMTSHYEPLPGLQMLYLPPRSFLCFLTDFTRFCTKPLCGSSPDGINLGVGGDFLHLVIFRGYYTPDYHKSC